MKCDCKVNIEDDNNREKNGQLRNLKIFNQVSLYYFYNNFFLKKNIQPIKDKMKKNGIVMLNNKKSQSYTNKMQSEKQSKKKIIEM